MREMGYEFTDLDLHEGWLFLEEASAERVIRDILIPYFIPELRGRLRTFSADGVANLEPTVREFQRLITFVHLQPVYEGRMWVRTDGDEAGKNALLKMREAFPNFDESILAWFEKPQFEYYYPEQFKERVEQTLAIPDKYPRRQAKLDLLRDAISWTQENKDEAKMAWQASAAEPISLLKRIAEKI